MKEGPAEIYKRSRKVFFRSLMDGIGKSGAAVDYHFALLNLQRHDGVVPMNHIDQMLQKMVEPVLKEEHDFSEFWAQQDDPQYQQLRLMQLMGRDAYFEYLDRMQRQAIQAQMGPPPTEPWTQQQHFQYRPIRDEQGNIIPDPVSVEQLSSGDQVVPGQQLTGADEPAAIMVGGTESEGEESPDTQLSLGQEQRDWSPGTYTFSAIGPKGEEIESRKYGGGAFGVENPEAMHTNDHHWDARVQLPQQGNLRLLGRTWPQILSSRAAGLDNDQGYDDTNPLGQGSPLHGDYNYENPVEGTFPPWIHLLRDYYLKPEDGGLSPAEKDAKREKKWQEFHKAHPQYEDSGAKVKIGHPIVDAIQDPDAYLGTAEQSAHDLYERHYKNWLASNDLLTSTYPDLHGENSERELRKTHMNEAMENWLKIGQMTSDEDGHPIGMGMFDYLFGLEWLSPEERTAVHEHYIQHGPHEPTKRRVAGAQNFEMGRLKRNLWSRFEPLYEHWGRDVDKTGPSIEGRDMPIAQSQAKPWHIRQAMDQTGLTRRIMEHHHAEKRPQELSSQEQKILDEGRQFTIPRLHKDGRYHDRDDSMMTTSEEELLMLSGIDPASLGGAGERDRFANLQFYKQGEHPHYPNWDPATSELARAGEGDDIRNTIRQIINSANTLAEDNYHGRIMSNAAGFYLNPRIDPNHGYAKNFADGDNDSMSTYWRKPFNGIGGFGRNHNILIDLLHQFTSVPVSDDAGQVTNEDQSYLGVSDARTREGRSDQQLATATRFSSNFDIGQKVAGMWSPFAPMGDKGRERRRYKEYDEVMVDGVKQRVGEKVKELRNVPAGKGELLTQHNTKISPAVPGGKNNFGRSMTSTSGPALNTAYKGSMDHHMKPEADEHNRFIKDGRTMDGQDSHLKGSNPFTHMDTPFAASPQEHNSEHISRKRAAQLGWTRNPLDPIDDYIDYDALEDHHLVGSLQQMRELMGLARGESTQGKDRPFVNTVARDELEGFETYLDETNQKLIGLETKMDELRHGIRSGTSQNPQEDGQEIVRLRTLIQQTRPLLEELENQYDSIDVDDTPTHEFFRSQPLATHDAKHKADKAIIAKQARKMLEEWETATGQKAFDPNDLWGSISNAMEFAAKANTFVNVNDPSAHGLSSLSVVHGEEPVEVAGGGLRDQIKRHINDKGALLSASSTNSEFFDALGFDPEDEYHQKTVEELKRKLTALSGGDAHKQFHLGTKGQLLQQSQLFGDFSGEESLFDNIVDTRAIARGGGAKVSGQPKIDGKKWTMAAPAISALGRINLATGDAKIANELGLHVVKGHHRHLRGQDNPFSEISKRGTRTKTKRTDEARGIQRTKRMSMTDSEKADIERDNALQRLESILISDPEIASKELSQTTKSGYRWAEQPIGNAGAPHGHTAHSIYDSHGSQTNWGFKVRPTAHVNISPNGKATYHHVPEGTDVRRNTLTRRMIGEIMPDILPFLGSHHGEVAETIPEAIRRGRMEDRPVNRRGSFRRSDGPTLLASLTNPDVLLKIDAEKPPSIQPMHRIFELDDLEHLRGFTGDWMVTLMPEGKRHFVRRKDDDIESWSTTSGKVSISEDDQKSFKKTTEKDFLIDVIQVDDEYHVFDILEFDDKDIHDLPIQERMKVLRGGMESHEKVMLPAAYNTRLTDDAGLESAVKDLEKEGKRILLRDAKSTYMAGEQRHPKWVLLAPGNDVNLIVLERRGEDPYSYRLGTGPITQEEKMGERGVELDGETYMDVGTVFSSPKKYEVGDHVEVNVDSVTSHQSDDETIYTIHAGSIEDEAEGEALVSRDTLEVMTKSEPTNWPHEVRRTDRHVTIRFPLGRIIYKATSRGEQWMVHSPEAENSLLIRMAESQRPFWAPVAGMMLKGNLDMVEEERKEEVHESKGDGKPLIPPKKVKDSDWFDSRWKDWKKVTEGLQAIEKTIGSVGQAFSGTRGLGIDYATPIQSPTGPTENKDQSALPDYDARKLPEEDPEEPYEKRKDKPQSIDLPVESEGEQGLLHVDDDTATLHIV